MLTSPDFAEFRRDHELPSVKDGDRNRVAQLVKLLPPYIEGEIPGIGFVHTNNDTKLAGEVCNAHRALLAKALARLQPRLQVVESLLQVSGKNETGHETDYLGMHLDGQPAYVDEEEQKGGLAGRWVLHTAAAGAAHVRLVNTRAGAFHSYQDRTDIGDAELFVSRFRDLRYLEEGDGGKRGYEGREGLGDNNLFDAIDLGSFDPLLTDPDVYHFDQHHLNSVLFKSHSMIGPATGHDFRRVGTIPRRIIVGTMQVRSYRREEDIMPWTIDQ